MQNIIALIFDCDGTLCPDTITFLLQQYRVSPRRFWRNVTQMVGKGWDPCLAYMSTIVDLVNRGRMPDLTNAKLRQIGEMIEFFPGIPQFFQDLPSLVRRGEFADAGILLEFYVVTGGFEEMIRGSVIAPFMTDIFGCAFDEDAQTQLVCSAKTAVTFTEKTKFIYAIQKGITGAELRRDPLRRLRYIGNTSGMVEGMKDLPEKVTYGKKKLLLFQKKTDKIKE